MKIKQKSDATEVAVFRKSTELTLPAGYMEELEQEAKDISATETPASKAFSTKAGVLSFNDQAMPNNEMDVIILESAFTQALYINKWDPAKVYAPMCFSISTTGEDMKADSLSFKPQGSGEDHECIGCEFNEWGSAGEGRKGKACKEGRRLVCIPVADTAEDIAKSSMATLSIPVTSIKNWGAYVHTLSATAKRPPWSVVTKVKLLPDEKNQFSVNFSIVHAINTPEQLDALKSLRARARLTALLPFGTMTQEEFDIIQAEKNKPVKKSKF